ncbi:hypothetical protein [Herpetosiphon gulosus]|uniref:KTSC domain-containing protein n=1 Tax=Herpetosiphon gulosus TaxID=1973496 RepID=A0ABP9X0I7_9CHLR
MTANNSTTPAFTKAIRYDRLTKDFALYLNGELIGYASSYSEGESRLNELVYEMLRRASHADISDLTPEDAEVALEVVTALADEEAATDSAEVVTVEAEANAQQVDVVPVFSYNIGGIEFTVGTDGALTVYAARRDEPAYGLCPDDTYALYLFLTKLPHVGPLLERAHMDRQHFLYGDMETKENSEGFDAAPSIVAHLAKARREKETVAADVA